MRCHYLSDLHLETQQCRGELPKGDVLIVAGDLCHASCLDPERTDKYSVNQRGRVMRFIDTALENFQHVLLVMGNHDHYDGVFDATAGLFKKHLPGVTVLDNESIEIDGVCFFGTTLWSDFEGRSEACMNAVRRRVGEFWRSARLSPSPASDRHPRAIGGGGRCWACLLPGGRAACPAGAKGWAWLFGGRATWPCAAPDKEAPQCHEAVAL